MKDQTKVSATLKLLTLLVSAILLLNVGWVKAEDSPLVTLTGKLNVIYGHSGKAGHTHNHSNQTNEEEAQYSLSTENGLVVSLNLDEKLLQPLGGAYALKGKLLLVTGRYTAVNSASQSKISVPFKVEALRLAVSATRVPQPTPPVGEQLGSKPYINLLCKFPDKPDAPFTPVDYAELFTALTR